MPSIAIDFGTSNCSAYLADPAGVNPVRLDGDSFTLPSVVFTARREVALQQVESQELARRLRKARAEEARNRSEGQPFISDEQLQKAIHDALKREAAVEAEKAYWDQTFFSILKSGQAIIFGTPALDAYFSDPLSGVLVKSPKSFLGSDIKHEHLARFEDVVAAMLGHIKAMAESAGGSEIGNVVLGRPVMYHGTQGETGNTQALDLMRAAAHRAGFTNVCFELEPLAAAYEYESTIAGEQTILVVDVGGGTTDCVMVRINPSRGKRRNRDKDVLGVAGDRIGGTDFDESLAWNAFMPAFGKDSLLTNGSPLPHSVLHDAISVRSVPAQLRFARAQLQIEGLIRQATCPEKLERLQTLQQQQLQYRLVHSAELGKIGLSKQDASTVALDYVEPDLAVVIDKRMLAEATSRLVDKIRRLATETIVSAGTRPDVVFMTGGMAISPIVRDAIADIAEGRPVRSSDMLGTVGKGLGLCAQRTFER